MLLNHVGPYYEGLEQHARVKQRLQRGAWGVGEIAGAEEPADGGTLGGEQAQEQDEDGGEGEDGVAAVMDDDLAAERAELEAARAVLRETIGKVLSAIEEVGKKGGVTAGALSLLATSPLIISCVLDMPPCCKHMLTHGCVLAPFLARRDQSDQAGGCCIEADAPWLRERVRREAGVFPGTYPPLSSRAAAADNTGIFSDT